MKINAGRSRNMKAGVKDERKKAEEREGETWKAGRGGRREDG